MYESLGKDSTKQLLIDAGLATPKTYDLFSSEQVLAESQRKRSDSELLLYGPIVSDAMRSYVVEMGIPAISPLWLNSELKKVKGDNLLLRINSPGGSWFQGSAMLSALEHDGRTVNTYVDGIAASFASVITLFGAKVGMGEMSGLFVHRPITAVAGYADNLRADADVLDQLEKQAMQFYGKRFKGQDVAALMRGTDGEGTHITAQQALESEMIDYVGAKSTPAKTDQPDAAMSRQRDAFRMAIASYKLSKGDLNVNV